MPKIKNSVVVITGASSGIGRATALEAARRKGTLVLVARDKDSLHEVVRECRRCGARSVLAIPADVTDEKSVHHLARKTIETFGKVDVWINNAAVSLFGRFDELPSEDFRRVIETNFFGYVHGVRAALPYFREQGYGVLINVSSVAGKVGQPFTSAYTTSKFAIDGFSESLRMDLGDSPEIHVCTVLPASIDTPLFEHAGNYSGRGIQPLKPTYSPERVATAVIRCAEHPKHEVVVGPAGRALLWLRALAPARAEKLLAWKVSREHFEQKPSRRGPGNLYESIPESNEISGDGSSGESGFAGRGVLAAGVFVAGAAAAAVVYRRMIHPAR